MAWLALLILALSATTDFFYVRFWQSVAEDRAWRAVWWSMALGSVNILSVYIVVWDLWTMPFALVGHGLGCYLSMRWKYGTSTQHLPGSEKAPG